MQKIAAAENIKSSATAIFFVQVNSNLTSLGNRNPIIWLCYTPGNPTQSFK
jgi:hypothetical protein